MNRRELLRTAMVLPFARAAAGKEPTRFQIACMTLPYAQFPLERALRGIAGAGATSRGVRRIARRARTGPRSSRPTMRRPRLGSSRRAAAGLASSPS